MPANFHPGGKHGSLVDRAVSGSHVLLMLRLDKGFTGKGPSVEVRIIVADKGSGGRRPRSTTNRASVPSLLYAIRQVPPVAVIQPASLPPPRRAENDGVPIGSFRAAPSQSFRRAARTGPS